MNQIVILALLYVSGLLPGLLFRKRIPVGLICSTAFLWGSLGWVVCSLFLLSFSIPITLVNISILFGCIMAVIVYFYLREPDKKFSKIELVWVSASTAAFLILLLAASRWNYSAATVDSLTKIMLGKSLVWDGITSLNQYSLGVMGSLTMMMQGISALIGSDYMYLVQPAFAWSLAFSFVMLAKEILKPQHKNWLPVSLLVLGLFVSTYLVRFQFFYIHDCFAAGAYLLVSLASFWLALKNHSGYWLITGMAGLLGFTLTRIESPIFAICFLAILVSTQQISKRTQWAAILPYLALVMLWYIRILFMVTDGRFLNVENGLFTIALLLGFGLFVYLSSRIPWLEQKVTPRLHSLMILVLVLALVGFSILKPEHIFTNISTILTNFFVKGLWGTTSVILAILLILQPVPKSPGREDRIYTVSFVAFLLLMILVGGLRNPYRLNWSDSGNRMLMHIIPSACLFLVIKYRHILEISRSVSSEETHGRIFGVLFIAVSVILLLLIGVFIVHLLTTNL